MKYLIHTYGCQMNEHDSERIAYLLEAMGYEPTSSRDDADFILYNTCLIRENAETKVYGQLGSLKHWKEERPDRILAVSGCMMQTGSARAVIEKKYRHVDIIFGTKNIGKLPQLVALHHETGERVVDISAYEEREQAAYHRVGNKFAYVNIMTGCNNFCTYCIVPYARGREKSRAPKDIVQEIRQLAADGYEEVMLLGQNVNSYGLGTDTRFPQLLRMVHEVEGIRRIRFMSSHPKDLSMELIDVMAACEKIERHFHLPLQSGSDRILADMNRHYSVERYLMLVQALREKIPGISLSTDLIVGFPGETEEDHQQTLALCRKVEFDSAFTFIYSPRPGTPAAKRSDQVDEKTASRRFQELLDVLYPIFRKKNEVDFGKRCVVLVEALSKSDPTKVSGRNSENKLIHLRGDASMIGQFVLVEIISGNSFALEGRVLE